MKNNFRKFVLLFIFILISNLSLGFVSYALALTCPKDCSGNGTCKVETGVCSCNAGFGGDDCSQKACEAGTELCSDGITCVKNKADCPVLCPEGTALCNDRITCVKDKTDCPQGCPQEKPVLCSDGTCAETESNCPVKKCSGDKPVECFDGSCVENKVLCPCAEGLVKCPDGSCEKDILVCQCSEEKPIKCPDGSCVTEKLQCPGIPICSEGLVQCSDATCAKDFAECPQFVTCPFDIPVLCPDGKCVANKEECIHKIDVKCPFEKAVLCPDGSCVTDPAFCKEIKKDKDVTLDDLVKFALRELNIARRHLSRSSPAARPISKKAFKFIRQIKKVFIEGGEECEDEVNDILDHLIELVSEAEELACLDEEDEFEEDCIPSDAVVAFSDAVNSAASIIFSAFDFDEDDDLVPDVCN